MTSFLLLVLGAICCCRFWAPGFGRLPERTPGASMIINVIVPYSSCWYMYHISETCLKCCYKLYRPTCGIASEQGFYLSVRTSSKVLIHVCLRWSTQRRGKCSRPQQLPILCSHAPNPNMGIWDGLKIAAIEYKCSVTPVAVPSSV